MDAPLDVLVWTSLASVFAVGTLYDVAVSLFGMPRPKQPPPASRRRRFAIFIAAHDEVAVIARSVESHCNQRYPRELREIFVVADRCSDETAAEARRAGATVFERQEHDAIGGKSAALRYLMERVTALRGKSDAICVFDADNLASPNYLEMMNRRLEAGECCIQGYLDVKNPNDSWITGAIAVAYWTTNRLWQAARYRLGLSCALGGTGFCIDWQTAEALEWGRGLTEDLDLQMQLVRRGQRVTWAHEARTFDEKPLGLRASWRQRNRWMRGHWVVAHRRFFPLVWQGVRHRDIVALDAAFYLVQPLRTVIAATLIAALGLSWLLGSPLASAWVSTAFLGLCVFYLAHYCFFGFPLVGLLLERIPLRYWRFYPGALLFGLTWIPAAFWGMMTIGRTAWNPTRHTRAMTIDQLGTRSGECAPPSVGEDLMVAELALAQPKGCLSADAAHPRARAESGRSQGCPPRPAPARASSSPAPLRNTT